MYIIKPVTSKAVTKRLVLSEIAQIIDPLGLLNPISILAKILLQKLWSLKLSWDESLPSDLHDYWLQYRTQLSEVNQLHIKRQVVIDKAVRVELHGFADASQDAYGCCVYIRSINSEKEIQVSLMCAKSKVAPLKSATIPRLELCACLLLGQLVDKVKSSLKLLFDSIILWSDSTVALSWIQSSPHLLNTFVANRVSQIQRLSKSVTWRHVTTKNNPADLASRGLLPEKLMNATLWWLGPEWLSLQESSWPDSKLIEELELPEVKEQIQSFAVSYSNSFRFENFSSLSRLKRVVAYCLRFVKNCREPGERTVGPLTSQELNKSLNCLLKLAQLESFPEEYRFLSDGKNVPSKSKLLYLNPFIDSAQLIRVGGRLQQSGLTDNRKHPVVLSSKHHLTKLLFSDEHIRLMHAGPQHMLSSIRERYWPIAGKSLAKQIVHGCIRCYRAKPKVVPPIMGALPKSRVQPTSPFHVTEIDYAGPILIRNKNGRGSKLIKSYICLFVCFATKAIHLELVSDLTKDGFIAAFRRFVSRRGIPQSVYSDNGLNFVGANAELKELGDFLRHEEKSLVETFHNKGVDWHFIPAHSPYFGGLWEAGVKSTKHHLKRVLANATLTFEDVTTVLVQIEGILNSRPLFPLSTDPNDMDVLTPSHFLIGKRLTSLPDPNVRENPIHDCRDFSRFSKSNNTSGPDGPKST